MAARMLAYLYASLTGIVGSFVGYLAGYEAVTTIVLVLHGMAAVAAAMWPPQAKRFDSKWMRRAAAWAEEGGVVDLEADEPLPAPFPPRSA
jgi:hypothetical protein